MKILPLLDLNILELHYCSLRSTVLAEFHFSQCIDCFFTGVFLCRWVKSESTVLFILIYGLNRLSKEHV